MMRRIDDWPEGLPERLFVVVHRCRDTDPEPDSERAVWTVSPSPAETGWETDGAYNGYGLPKRVAEEIARRYNSMGVKRYDLDI